MTTLTMTNLAEMDQEHYATLVDDEIRGKAPASAAAELRRPENLDRWYAQLVTIKQSVESQLGVKRSEIKRTVLDAEARGTAATEEKSKYEGWRISVLRFKSGVESRLAEVNHLRRQALGETGPDRTEQERNRYGQQVSLLRKAIKEHHDRSVSDDLEPTDFDVELWATIGLSDE